MENSIKQGRSNSRSPQAFNKSRPSSGRPNFRRSSSNKPGQFSRTPNRGRGGKRFAGKFIHPDKFVNKNPKNKEAIEYTPKHTFADFEFDSAVATNIAKGGYVKPSRIQDEAIPHVLEGRDLIGLANTGSGKTAAFILPIIQKIRNSNGVESALIITPTRELASQIEDEFRKFSFGLKLYSALCVGGMNIRPQKAQLSRRPNVIIGTPGRLKDLFEQKALNLSKTSILVFDEADRMLDMGFLPDIEFLTSKLPEKRQTLCFSATISPEISRLLDKKLVNPVTVSVRTSETGEHIAQDVIKVKNQSEKFDRLISMLSEAHFERVLIFGEMKHGVQRLADDLTQKGFPSQAIHGNKSQPQRQRALDAFKSGKVKVLVATDVAARGLDIPNVSHVINFDKPNTYDDYIHRIGRTGRAGKGGQAYTFIHY